MAKKKALILVNPRSGRIVARQLAFNFGHDFQGSEYEPFIRMTTGPGDAADVAARLASAFDLVVCRGGDGTLNETINGVLCSGADVPIGYIPAGTTNDFAKSNGLPFVPAEAIRVILEGEPMPQDVGLFGEERYFCYTASFGMFTRSSYATNQKTKNRFGYAAYLAAGAREVFHIEEIPVRVTADGVVYEGDYIFGSVTNAYAVGGGVLKFSRDKVRLDDGLMELVLIKKPKKPDEMVRLFLDLQRGIYDERFITVVPGKVFLFEFPAFDVPWTLDGEFGGKTHEVAVQCIEHGFRIIKEQEALS